MRSKHILIKELKTIAQKGRKRLESRGIKETSIDTIVHDARIRK